MSFVGHLDGVQLSPGVYATHTLRQEFKIGRSLIVVASTSEHSMKVFKDRKLVATWPISTGRPGKDTPNGTYLSIEKANPQHMVGDDYDIQVPYSVRFTWSGDFIHAAPWSVGSQGYANVSHGCVNLAPDRAQTYYYWSIPGDPVTVTGSPKAGRWDDGYTVWFLILEGAGQGQRAAQGGAGGAGRQYPGPALGSQEVAREGAARPAEAGQRRALLMATAVASAGSAMSSVGRPVRTRSALLSQPLIRRCAVASACRPSTRHGGAPTSPAASRHRRAQRDARGASPRTCERIMRVGDRLDVALDDTPTSVVTRPSREARRPVTARRCEPCRAVEPVVCSLSWVESQG